MTLALRTLVAGVVAIGVLTAPYAQATPGIDSYTAAMQPSLVQAQSNKTYTVTLTSNSDSPDKANHATVAVPAGFTGLANLGATVTGGGCGDFTWTVDAGSGSSIDLSAPVGGELCAGATLTMHFDATAPASDNSYQWTPTLTHDTSSFQPEVADPTVVVDGTAPPPPAIDSQPPALANQTTASFGFSDAEAAASFTCRLDSATFVPCASPKDYTGLADGSHTFDVVAVDAAGNKSSAASYTWSVDTVPPPLPVIDAGPPSASGSSSASFTFSDPEAGAGFECRLDGAIFSSCNSPSVFSGLPDGAHTFRVRARDTSDNPSVETTYTWTIDTVNPLATIGSGPLAVTNQTTATLSFSSNEAGASFECKLDSGSFASCTSPKSYSSLAEGSRTFYVRATDAAGNTGPEARYSWTVDTTDPAVTSGSGPSSPTNQTTATLSFSSNEAGSTFECKLDSESFAACTSPKSYSGLTAGSHTFHVRATDAADNTGPEVTVTWMVDTVAPTVMLTSTPAALTNDRTPSFGFSATEPGSTFSCELDGGGFSSCTSGVTYSAQADGEHTFVVMATDAAGNPGPEESYTWTIDTVGPNVAITGPPPVTSQTSASLSFSSSEPGSTFECSLDSEPFAACSSPKAYSALSDRAHNVRVRATDPAGNTGRVASYSWSIDTVNPVVTIASGPAPATNQATASFIFSSNTPGSAFECQLDSGPFGSCASPKTYSGLAEGPHSFGVRATGPGGNTGLTTPYEWTIDTAAPPSPAIGGGPPSATNQRAATFVFADGEVGASFTCQLDSGPIASCSSPKSYSELADGPHTFAVRAQDAVGNVSSPNSYNWTVDTLAPDTAISSGPSLDSSSASASFTFASNEAGASFSCRLDGGGISPCTSPQTYGGLTDGPHTLAVRAVDAAGNVDSTPASWSWTVATPRAPDTTPPGRVSRLTAAVSYRLVRLSWRLPRDPDFDHVSVFVSTNKRGPLQGSVYTGKGTTFAYKRFRNGTYYRFAAISYDRAGNHSVEARVAVTPSALLRSPRDGAVVRKPPLLSWMAVSGATYYNVQLVYGGRKILSAWPKQPRLQLKRSWRYGGAHRLKKGLYNWYVWPGLGARSAARYGQLLGHGSFVVR